MQISEILPGSHIDGFLPNCLIEVVAATPMGNAINLVYQRVDTNALCRELVMSNDPRLASMQVALVGKPWSFTAPGAGWKMAVEATRIRLSYLFESMMAVYTSKVDPLPHQLMAVYEAMLPRQPLRFLLADDPGAGKTIMAGLLIRELMLRADAKRILIVSPGSLTSQWADELWEKFGMQFDVYENSMAQNSAINNAFQQHDRLVIRLDQLSRNEELQDKLLQSDEYDLIVVDEAHKLSAHYWAGELEKTARFKLGERLGAHTRNFLLMTATPHSGKQEDFEVFLTLLDSDRFYGKNRDASRKIDVSDMMRRMVKEELVKFDGTPLFPERKATTVHYTLSKLESELYLQVTNYVRNEMNRAERLKEGGRKLTVGFALTSLQRRLASSPNAIYQSLLRRKKKLSDQFADVKRQAQGLVSEEEVLLRMIAERNKVAENFDEDEATGEEFEDWDTNVSGGMTAAETLDELGQEIQTLEGLLFIAKQVVDSDQDSKWSQVRDLLEGEEFREQDGRRRQLIIFTEHKDTLDYLHLKIKDKLGNENEVAIIYGGTPRDKRKQIQESFRFERDIRILICTDAAGEGVNLQSASLLINYDLPWNPNRMEQRFGRIHRIGQTQCCHMWNLVSKETREGQVWDTILEKLEVEKKALGGKVFNILGDLFEDRPLRDMMIDAIKFNNSPEVKAKLTEMVEGAFDRTKIEALLQERALDTQTMASTKLHELRDAMEKAEARKMQPYYVRSFFLKAFPEIGGDVRNREKGRFEIGRVPASLHERDRRSGTGDPLLKKYARVCFEKENLRIEGKIEEAKLLHPGHPLVATTMEEILDRNGKYLKEGAVLVDPSETAAQPYILFLMEHTIEEGNPKIAKREIASRRIHFIRVFPDGTASFAGWAPHLDLRPASDSEVKAVKAIGSQAWVSQTAEEIAKGKAVEMVATEHQQEVVTARKKEIDKMMQAVEERLTSEIIYSSRRAAELRLAVSEGKQPKMQADNFERRVDELTARLDARKRELNAMRDLLVKPPEILGACLVVPEIMVSGETIISSVDVDARRQVELIAMNAVSKQFASKGYVVRDVSAQKCGWDISADLIELVNSKEVVKKTLHIEVKGRVSGSDTVTISHNEIMSACNQGEKFILAVVLVNGGKIDGPHYIPKPWDKEPAPDDVSINKSLSKLLERAMTIEGVA